MFSIAAISVVTTTNNRSTYLNLASRDIPDGTDEGAQVTVSKHARDADVGDEPIG